MDLDSDSLGQAQTIHDLTSRVLSTFVLAYRKTISIVYDELLKGHVMDGEDCWLDHYGVQIHILESVESVVDFIEETLDRLDAASDGEDYQTSTVQWAFDERISGRLRQNMPLPPTDIPSPKEAWRELSEVLSSLTRLDGLHESRDPAHWDVSRPVIGAADFSSAFEDKLGRNQILLPSQDRYSSSNASSGDGLVSAWMSGQTRLPPDVIQQLDNEILQAGDAKKRQTFALWRDMVSGRRSYLSRAEEWAERAAVALRISDSTYFSTVAMALQAKRLDCLLEASLSAWDLELIPPNEEQESWWWIKQITEARLDLPLETSWEMSWAGIWASIAGAMLLVSAKRGSRLTFLATNCISRGRSCDPLSSATKLQPAAQMGAEKASIVRRHSHPTTSDARLRVVDAISIGDGYRRALDFFNEASTKLSDLSFALTSQPFTENILGIVAANLDIMRKGHHNLDWDWKERRGREWQKWLLRLIPC
ncbi:hypothetical protein P7C73_g1823, partial [Tremellales sp. Uapishka_1]